MRKSIIFILTLVILTFMVSRPALAFQKVSFLSLTMPVRELIPTVDLPQTTTELPDLIYKLATPSATPITWLLQYDTIRSSTDSAFFKTLDEDRSQEIGLLLEITPKLVSDTGLSNTGATLLNNFPPEERIKIIDQAFKAYFDKFGTYPRTVQAQYIDSYSLAYLSQKYNVKTAVFSNDDPHVKTNGNYDFFPYYPTRLNSLVPAQTPTDKLTITIVHKNPTDLSGSSSLNLETMQKLTDNKRGLENLFDRYAQKDLNEFTDLNIGVDNNTPKETYLPIFKKTLVAIENSKSKDTLTPITAGNFGEWFIEHYPITSPAFYYKDITNNKITIWYTNPFYQTKLESVNDKAKISELTVFSNKDTEDFRFDFNRQATFFENYPRVQNTSQNSIDLDLGKAVVSNYYWQLFLNDNHKVMHFDTHQITAQNISLPTTVTQTFSTTNNLRNIVLRILILALLVLVFIKFTPKQPKELLKKNKGSILIILFGCLVQMVTMFKSGTFTDYGLSFWGPHGHDAFVHLALIEGFKQSIWPLVNPTLINSPLVNYHILFDFLAAIISKITAISSLDLYFRILPLVLSLSLGGLSLCLMRQFKWSKGEIWLSLVLIYFAGSWGFLVGHGESAFWATQAISVLINPPLVLSLVLLLLFLNLFHAWQAKLSWQKTFILSFLGGLLIQAKSYSAVLLVCSLAIVTFIAYLKKLPQYKALLVLTVFTTFLAFLLFLPTYKQSTGLFSINPLWFVRSMIDSPDRLGWQRAAQAWLAYDINKSLVKLTLLQVIGVFIFYFGNLGIRALGVKKLFQNLRAKNLTIALITWISILGLLIPIIFIQASNPWNSIQFMYYSLFFLSLLTGPILKKAFFDSRTLVRFGYISFIVIILTVPTTLSTIRDYLSPIPATVITPTELKALNKLRSLPRGLVITPMFEESIARSFMEPKPNADYTSTAYVSALSGQPTYFTDEINLNISGYAFTDIKRDNQRLFKTTDTQWIKDFLTQNNIRYVYIPYPNHLSVDPALVGLYPIFESPTINLYQHNL